MYELTSADRNAPPYDGPALSVTDVRAVVRDGWYNAFADLVLWRDYYWLSYRRGTKHHADHGMVVVLRSSDLQRWQEVAVLDRPQGISGVIDSGVQDGHFCVAGDRLCITINTRVPTEEYLSWTDDGINWSEPLLQTMEGFEPFIWRMTYHDDRFWCATSGPESDPLYLIVSDDGIIWTEHARIAGTNVHDWSGETDLLFRPDGELWCVVRSEWPGVFFRSRPPYTEWEGGHSIGLCDAPSICEADGEVFVAGRLRVPLFEGDLRLHPQGTTGVYHLRRGGARPLLAFPVGGDSAYSGLITTGPGKLAIAYFSDVAYWSGVLPPKSADRYQYKVTDCDIYVAEIDIVNG